MDCEEEVIFCQESFMTESFDAFEDMRRNEELVDFKIAFENRSVVGHRLVLAARIPHFREVFCSSHNEVTLNEVDPDALESVINFAYSGKIKITFENVVSLLSASKVLQLTQVFDACWDFVEKRLSFSNVLEIRRFGEEHCCSKFLEAADSYIRQNFEDFTNSESFLAVPFQQLKEIISRDDIKVTTEEKVFEAVVRWVKASPTERSDLLPELLCSVRMYFLTPDYLVERVSNEELVRSSLRCRDLVEEAKNYHLLPDKRSTFLRLPSQSRHIGKSLDFRLVPELGYSKQHRPTPDYNTTRIFIHAVYQECETFYVTLFDLENEWWLHFSNYKPRGEMQTVELLDGVIYIFATSCVHTFNANTYKWNSFDYEHCVLASGNVACYGRIYFFGGILEESFMVRCFDPRTHRILQIGNMPRPLKYPGVALVNSSSRGSLETSMFVTGGHFEDVVYNSVERYNPETKEWIEISSMFYKRYCHGCCDVNDKIYVCGGLTNAMKPLTSTEVYDPLTNQWKIVSSMKHPRFILSVTSAENKLYVCCKRHHRSVHNGDIELYDPKTDEWKSGPRIPETNTTNKIFITKSVVSGCIDGSIRL